MKKIIIKGVIFVLILFLFLLMLSRIFIPKNNSKKAGIIQERLRAVGVFAEPENTLDVMIIGDSEAYTSFIPLEAWNEYGYTSYASGGPKLKLTDLDRLLDEILEKQKPKIIMLETYIIYRKIPVSDLIAQPVKKVLPGLEYHDRWKSLKLNDFFGEIEYTNIEKDKGFYLKEEIKGCKNKEYMKKTTKAKEIPEINEFYVKKIKEYCDLIGAELVLYSCPSQKNWNMQKHNGIELLANELEVEYIDLNLMQEQIQIDWTKDTRDEGDHLNYTGALKSTKFLSKYLSEKNLPDHREDNNYNEWNELYRKYKERTTTKDNKIDN